MSDENQPPASTVTPTERRSRSIGVAHVVQVLQIVFILGVGVAFIMTRADLDTLRAEFMRAHTSMDIRMTVAERAIVERQGEEHDFAVEMRAALKEVNATLTELRFQIMRRR